MYLIIKDKYKLIHHDLNLVVHLTYRGIKIYKSHNEFYISLKDHYHFSDGGKIRKLEIKDYIVINDFDFSEIRIYVYENRSNVDKYRLFELTDFIISSSSRADITNHDKYSDDKYLILKDGYLSGNCDPSVNGFKYNQQKLSANDVVEFLGIRFIYYDEYIYLNSFNCTIKLKEYKVNEHRITYPLIKLNPSFHIPEVVEELTVEDLEEFSPVEKNSIGSFIRTILPNTVMAISVSLMAYINYYNSLLNTYSYTSSYSFLVMPLSIIMTGIAIPAGFYLYDRNNTNKKYISKKNEYLKYLDDYEKQLEEKIEKYINSLNSTFFDISNSKNKMFSVGENSRDFLLLSLGKKQIERNLEYNKTEDTDINDKLERIRRRLLHIDDYPIFLDLKKHKRVTIVAKDYLKAYFFNRILLELSYKHHYDDVLIGIYAQNLSIINSFYNLPHLFAYGRRMTLNSIKQMQELDQLKLNKPLILLMYDTCDYVFTNKNIHIIYLTDRSNDLYKDSDIIVEYHNGTSYIYGHDFKQQFTFVQHDLDFTKHFLDLGRLNRSFNDHYYRSFEDLFSFKDIEYMYRNPDGFLKADFAFGNNEMLAFDLHQSKQGPHGLIAGSTGSGKSELIISLLLSLCLRYPADYLNIVLIDYKGGGIEESLSYKGKTMPHIIASLSNLENNNFERLIIALKNECIRRQKLFKHLSAISNSSIMSIDDYNGCPYDKEKISHLLIVVDEFAELKMQQADFIKELISISRIGRSLGIYLILATQKPSGNIDDEIWTNSRFKIALKVFEDKDSMDVIRVKDAAYLSEPGSFILKVDEALLKAKSIYAKQDINKLDKYEVSILDNTLEKTKTYIRKGETSLTEASAYTKHIISLTNQLNIKTNRLDFLPPESCKRKMLVRGACFVFGEVDDYLNNKKSLLAYGIKENILIYSNRKKEINSIINTLDENRRTNIIITNRSYNSAYTSDLISYDNNDDIQYLFNRLRNDNLNITIIIEDIQTFLSYDDTYLDMLSKIVKRSETMNYNFVLLSNNAQISYRLLNLFRYKVMLKVDDMNDVTYFYNVRSRYKGNNFFYKEEPVTFVSIIEEDLIETNKAVKPLIKQIPEKIYPQSDNSYYLIGYNLKTREKIMAEGKILICSYDEKLLEPYKKAYKNKADIRLYNNSLLKNSYTDILWLGTGVYMQRLFIPDIKKDLINSQGLYISGGIQTIIRSIDHA